MPKQQEPEQVKQKTSLPPPLIRPDRQIVYEDASTHYDWPLVKELHDRDTITVDRITADIDGPAHRFVIKRGDSVDVWFRADDFHKGTVTGISHANWEVRVATVEGSEGSWHKLGCIYPALEPEPAKPKNGVSLTAIIEKLNAENTPPGGWSTQQEVLLSNPASEAQITPDLDALSADVLKFLGNHQGQEVPLSELRRDMGFPELDKEDPLSNPVHQALKNLRDSGKVHVVDQRFGESRVSLLTWPSSPKEYGQWKYPDSLSGPEVVHLMRQHQVTIETLADRAQFTKKHVREVRERGLNSHGAIRDWFEAIAKPPVEGGITPSGAKGYSATQVRC